MSLLLFFIMIEEINKRRISGTIYFAAFFERKYLKLFLSFFSPPVGAYGNTPNIFMPNYFWDTHDILCFSPLSLKGKESGSHEVVASPKVPKGCLRQNPWRNRIRV